MLVYNSRLAKYIEVGQKHAVSFELVGILYEEFQNERVSCETYLRMESKTLTYLFQMVAEIPEGKVTGYGALGRNLPNPVSGLLVGRWMSSCPPDLPWWRVVASDGKLPVWKKDPTLEVIQRQRLEEEGIQFDLEDRVKVDLFWWEPSGV